MMQLSAFPIIVECFLRVVILKFYFLLNLIYNFYMYHLIIIFAFFFKFYSLRINWVQNFIYYLEWKPMVIHVSRNYLHYWILLAYHCLPKALNLKHSIFLWKYRLVIVTYVHMDFLFVAIRRTERPWRKD